MAEEEPRIVFVRFLDKLEEISYRPMKQAIFFSEYFARFDKSKIVGMVTTLEILLMHAKQVKQQQLSK